MLHHHQEEVTEAELTETLMRMSDDLLAIVHKALYGSPCGALGESGEDLIPFILEYYFPSTPA